MTTAAALHDLTPDETRARTAPLARAILVHAALAGLAADLLVRDGIGGLGLPAWLLLLATITVSLVWRDGRGVPRETRLWLAIAVLLGSAMAWRNAGLLQFLDFATAVGALGMAAVSLDNPRAALLAERLRDIVRAGLRVIGSVAFGAFPLVVRDVADTRERVTMHGRFRPALRAAIIALPLVIVFGALLRDADPLFASFVALPDVDIGTAVSHLVVVGFFAWITAGWARAALLQQPMSRLPDALPFSLGTLDVTVALGALNALFALYVASQLGWFFGGERYLRLQTGLTAAQYARQGFFQMAWVALLVVPLLLVTRAALRTERGLERRHTALSVPLIALLGVMILSAMLRMRLYVRYYGLTLDRYYPLVFMGWLAIVLAWLALTVLRGRGRVFVAGAVASGLAVLLALNVVVPDVVVARVNLARAAASPRAASLDLEYLATLGGDAVPDVVRAIVAAPVTSDATAQAIALETSRCEAAGELVARWASWGSWAQELDGSAAAWRGWNRGASVARHAVADNAAALRAVRQRACAARRDAASSARQP